MKADQFQVLLPVSGHLDLDVTMLSGQCFAWRTPCLGSGLWDGYVDHSPVRVEISQNQGSQEPKLLVRSEHELSSKQIEKVRHFFQLNADPSQIIQQFPNDSGIHLAVQSCQGLRLLRQPPWICMAGFILSSTKRIDQIQELVKRLSIAYGDPLNFLQTSSGLDWQVSHAFPDAQQIAAVSEADLRKLGLGFRAPYLKAAAERVAKEPQVLSDLGNLLYEEVREWLMEIPGVGSKIADCVALFAYGFQEAFPLDVWMQKILRHLYFDNRSVSLKELDTFQKKQFAPWGGYVQQFLFHAARTGVFPRLK